MLPSESFNYECAICGDEFLDRLLWKQHTQNHINPLKTLIQCIKCPKKFPNSSELHLHTINHHYHNKSTQTEKNKDEYEQQNYDTILIKKNTDEEMLITDVIDDIKVESLPKSSAGVNNTKQIPQIPKPMTENEPCSCVLCGDLIFDLMAVPILKVQEEVEKHKKIQCNICGKQFQIIRCFMQHRLTHYYKKSNKTVSRRRDDKNDEFWASCLSCKEKHFITTIRTNNENLTLKCKYAHCNRVFKNEYSLSRHHRDHIDRRVYYCTICGKSVIGRITYYAHVGGHTSNQSLHRNRQQQPTNHYECDICGKQLNCNKISLKDHLLRHVNCSTMVSCQFCQKSLQKYNLKKHITIYHNDKTPFVCDLCGASFKFSHRLAHHVRIKHTRDYPYECSICKRKFMILHSMEKHKLTHTGEKPLKCDQCDKHYRDPTDLRRHKRIHGGVAKKHACDMCDQRFYEPKQLRKHKLMVHNVSS